MHAEPGPGGAVVRGDEHAHGGPDVKTLAWAAGQNARVNRHGIDRQIGQVAGDVLPGIAAVGGFEDMPLAGAAAVEEGENNFRTAGIDAKTIHALLGQATIELGKPVAAVVQIDEHVA